LTDAADFTDQRPIAADRTALHTVVLFNFTVIVWPPGNQGKKFNNSAASGNHQ
jgi:hypothetical protein